MTVIQIGNVMPTATRDNPNQGRVYDPDGLAPCLNKMEGGGREPYIIDTKKVGAPRFYEGIAPTLQSNDYKEPLKVIECRACLTPDRPEKRQNGRRLKNPNEPMFTLTKQDIHGACYENRIRRLTTRECMRLQGVPDYITDKLISAGISDTQLYRAAGDACTATVVYAIASRLEAT